ncbi:hypothetical protein D0Z07_2051 [Hyphodiscus hymeniophilus]|uniref:DUF202 domain-containing protein n=1 Tax=Hyphodiscus hymeniophilus TaxID=353542 RepID=A0A9P6VN51_9HELO|nr:hypothetical protein D0Z07_2051 [Hyphodiscus hymeniophilus]
MAETSDQDPQALIGEPEEPDVPHPTAPTEDLPTGADAEERDAREATELALLDRLRRNYSHASTAHQQGSSTAARKPSTFLARFTYGVSKFWRHQIRVTVPYDTCRDHLGMSKEQVPLPTSLALSMIGITVAQLFRLQHAPTPNALFGFYVLGKPLACICQGAAIYTLMIGAFRTWRSQNAIVRSKAITGGFEIVLLAAGVFIILVLFFVLLIAVDISKEDVTSK